jgi:hypothetical protein
MGGPAVAAAVVMVDGVEGVGVTPPTLPPPILIPPVKAAEDNNGGGGGGLLPGAFLYK